MRVELARLSSALLHYSTVPLYGNIGLLALQVPQKKRAIRRRTRARACASHSKALSYGNFAVYYHHNQRQSSRNAAWKPLFQRIMGRVWELKVPASGRDKRIATHCLTFSGISASLAGIYQRSQRRHCGVVMLLPCSVLMSSQQIWRNHLWASSHSRAARIAFRARGAGFR